MRLCRMREDERRREAGLRRDQVESHVTSHKSAVQRSLPNLALTPVDGYKVIAEIG
jgi:hypothetical protein